MKRRHEQKLLVLSFVLLFLFNIPLLLIFNQSGDVGGIPLLYFFIFLIWLISILISAYLLKRFHE
ncbi:hypothetical protein BD809_1146 [Aquimarina intermedia]|uniref:DUF3311 domain-containing protein n=1 Tax=Aquimarina intermedia TaxID=350814 RepID=A0A5S5BUK2_9FLAO|nr:hypothetical protein BD809_1146 [Aquimarina intermedia]